MTDDADRPQAGSPTRAHADVAADRQCMCCRRTFHSAGFGERICTRCKGKTTWRASVRETVSTGRRLGTRS